MSRELRITGVSGIPEITSGDDLVCLIATAIRNRPLAIDAGDVIVVTQKIVSKAEGRLSRLSDVEPSGLASAWALRWGLDARTIELVLREARRIVRMERGILIVETSHGFVCANAGIDASNMPDGIVALLPEDPDRSAQRIREGLERAFQVPLGVIISDTFGRPWREGFVDVALGVAGLRPFVDYRGQADTFGRRLHHTRMAVVDELASAAELVMGKVAGIPVAVIQGAAIEVDGGKGRELIRDQELDLFR